MASGPGYAQKPEHEVKVAPERARLRVTLDGEMLAESAAALALAESGCGVVHYFPKADVRTAKLSRTAHTSYCPFKGKASYWSLAVGGRTLDNVVWSYEEPYDEVAAIKGHVAFWLAKIPGAKVERV
jgi:uncharacterized protein (DUF427 family)